MDVRCKYSPKLGVAITGSTGFVGRNLIDAFDSDDFESMPFDSVRSGALVIHLASDVSATRDALLSNLAVDTWLLEIVNRRHRGLVYASTNNVYPHAVDCCVDERLRCGDYYSASKVFGEKLIAEFSLVPTVSLRIADVFGLGQRHGNLFRAIESSIISGAALKLYGNGLKRRSYIHVVELCEIIKFISTQCLDDFRPGLALNIGYSDSATVSEIMEMVSDLSGLPIENLPLEVDVSGCDIRTLKPSFLPSYAPKWGSFREALAVHVDQIRLITQKRMLS